MARIPSRSSVAEGIDAVAGRSLRTAGLSAMYMSPPGSSPLTLLATWTASRTYRMIGLDYSISVGSTLLANVVVGFSPNPAAYTSSAMASDVMILSKLVSAVNERRTLSEFLNFTPFYFDVPVGGTVSMLIADMNLAPFPQAQFINVILYLNETFEQS